MYNVYDLLVFHSTVRPAAPFLILGQRSFSFGDVKARVDSFSSSLRDSGVKSGDRVVISCQDPLGYVVAVMSTWSIEAVVAPIEPNLAEGEYETLLRVAQANWIVSSGADGADLALKPTGNAPCDWPTNIRKPAQLLFTSGSSGIPKAVILSQESLMAAAIECADSIALRPNDVQMTTVPFWHAYGQNRGLNATLFAGASVAPVFDDNLAIRVAELKRLRPTILFSVASFFGFLAFSKQQIGGRLRAAVAGAAPLPVPVKEKFEAFYDAPLLTTYGLTEFLLISCQRLADNRVSGSVGFPCRGVELKIADDEGNSIAAGSPGRIWVRGCYAMEGYLGSSDKELTSDGWLDTEDLGTMDGTGLRVLGRASAFIKRSGYKVYPVEIQNVVAQHEDVVDVAVAKFVSMLGGEELAVEVVLRDGSLTTVEDILEYCKTSLPIYKIPAACRQVMEIPKLPSGKPDLLRISKNATQG